MSLAKGGLVERITKGREKVTVREALKETGADVSRKDSKTEKLLRSDVVREASRVGVTKLSERISEAVGIPAKEVREKLTETLRVSETRTKPAEGSPRASLSRALRGRRIAQGALPAFATGGIVQRAKARPVLKADDPALQVVKAPGGQHVVVRQEGSAAPEVVRVADSMRALGFDHPAKVADVRTVEDRKVRSLVTGAVRRSSTESRSLRESSVIRRMAQRVGIQAFAKGGVVRPVRRLEADEEERDFEGIPVRKPRTGAPVPKHTARASGGSGLQPAVRWVADTLNQKFGTSVTSAVRPGDPGFHGRGLAADIAGPKMRQAAQYVKDSGLYRTLLEGIHNPNLSADSGKIVSSGFWGTETWREHKDHVHLAAQNISVAVKRKLEGGDAVGGPKKPRRITGGSLSLGQIVTLAKRVGFPDPALAAAVAFAESRGRVGAVGDGGDSLGLWQINTPAHPNFKPERLQHDALYNARAALSISKKGKTWQPWTQFRTGAYKQFLGGKATPLPGPGKERTAASGSSLADYLAFRLEQAETTPGETDDTRWINKGLRYWRRVLRRNKKIGNFQRASEALSRVTSLRDKKKELLTPPDESVFQLGGLSKIGKVNIAGLQKQLDHIDLDVANAALTETIDAEGNVTPASFADDIAALSHAVQIRQDLYDMTRGTWLESQVEEPSSKGPKVFRLNDGRYAVTVKGRTYTFSGTPGQEFIAGGKKVRIPGGPPGVKREWNVGTRAQQTEAATDLKSARDALKSVQDDAKSEGVSADAAAEPRLKPSEEIANFLASLFDLKKQFGRNFQTLPAFAKGGVLKHALALVGEQGYELAERGGKFTIVGAQGPEVRELPVGTRIHSHPDTKRKLPQLFQQVTQRVARVFSGSEQPGLARPVTSGQLAPRIQSTSQALSRAWPASAEAELRKLTASRSLAQTYARRSAPLLRRLRTMEGAVAASRALGPALPALVERSLVRIRDAGFPLPSFIVRDRDKATGEPARQTHIATPQSDRVALRVPAPRYDLPRIELLNHAPTVPPIPLATGGVLRSHALERITERTGLQTTRMAKQMGIQPLAQGGVIRPVQTQDTAPDKELARALERIEALLKRQEPTARRETVEQHLHFSSPPEEQHTVQKSALWELENSL